MAATLLLFQQLTRARRRSDLRERDTLANTPLCAEESPCLKRCPCCRRFTCTGLVLTFMGVVTVGLLAVSIVSTVITRYSEFDATTLSLSPGDTKQIQDGFSYTFCKSVSLTPSSKSTSFDAYLLETERGLASSMDGIFYQQENVTIKAHGWYHWRAHLIAGSKVTVEIALGEATPCKSLTYYVTAGEEDFESLLSDSSCHCIIAEHSPCSSSVELIARATTDYYFVIANAFDVQVNTKLNVTWERRTYQILQIANECHSAGCFGDVCYHSDCVLAVPESTALVVTIPQSSNSSLTDLTEIEMICDPQVIAYVILFATLPLVGFAVLLPVGFIIIHVARRIEPRKARRRRHAGACNDNVCTDIPMSDLGPVEIRLCPPPYDGAGPPPPYESSQQQQTVGTTQTEAVISPVTEDLPAAPPSYEESSRDFVVALAAPAPS